VPAHARAAKLGLRDALGFVSSNAFTAGHATLLRVDPGPGKTPGWPGAAL